jgi:hypothetical protein
MPKVTARGSGQRTVTAGITSASAAVTGAAGTFDTTNDVGRSVTGTGIPAGTTLSAVASATAATLSANATATNAAAVLKLGERATLAQRFASEAAFGFRGVVAETAVEATAYQLSGNLTGGAAGVNEPGRITDPNTGRDRRYV